jgi:hypothetical protein
VQVECDPGVEIQGFGQTSAAAASVKEKLEKLGKLRKLKKLKRLKKLKQLKEVKKLKKRKRNSNSLGEEATGPWLSSTRLKPQPPAAVGDVQEEAKVGAVSNKKNSRRKLTPSPGRSTRTLSPSALTVDDGSARPSPRGQG